MSYVQANTSNPLGRRALGRLRGLGWDNAPYPVYPISRNVARLNGVGDENNNGSITYRIDPRTGQYNFYRTDIKPRGVFLQNTFQHPAPPVMSALGTRVLPAGRSVTGSTIQRGRTSQGPMIAMRPGVQLSGLGCNDCGGRCNSLDGPRFARRRFMGDVTDPSAPPSSDISIDPNTGCQVDSDGVVLTCPIGPGGSQQPTKPTITIPANTADPGLLQQLIVGGLQSVTGPRVVVQQQQPPTNPFAGISTSVLATGAVLFGALLMGRKRR
jgi:hypothetical protein